MEGQLEILEVLTRGGASQLACEEALLEASYLGRARSGEMLMGSDMIPALRWLCMLLSLLAAAASLMELLQSSKPFLHTNVYCNVLISAIVSQQISVVKTPLAGAGARTDIKLSLEGWSWDVNTGEVSGGCRTSRGLQLDLNASVTAESAWWAIGFRQAVVDVIRSANGIEALKKLIEGADIDHNEQDEKGYSAAMIAAEGGYLEIFKLLIDQEEVLCEPLISLGAKCDIANARYETALLLARKSRIHEGIAANPCRNAVVDIRAFKDEAMENAKNKREEFGGGGGGMGAWLSFSGFESRQFGDGDGSVEVDNRET
ncbi:hypothetical protein TB2_020992 [Malus domestica]